MRKREDSTAEVLESILLLLAEVGEAVVRDGSQKPLFNQSENTQAIQPQLASTTSADYLEDQTQVRQRAFR
jgi:hypothetical protein